MNFDIRDFQHQHSNYVPWDKTMCVSEHQFSHLQNEDKMLLSKWQLCELYKVMQRKIAAHRKCLIKQLTPLPMNTKIFHILCRH